MKYEPGDKIIVLLTNEEGQVVEIMNEKMVMIEPGQGLPRSALFAYENDTWMLTVGRRAADGEPPADLAGMLANELAGTEKFKLVERHKLGALQWRLRAGGSKDHANVVAAGAIERPIVFAGNDTPGVMMASAMRSYINRYAATPAKRIALFTNNEDGWRTVETALGAGLQIAAVVDARNASSVLR